MVSKYSARTVAKARTRVDNGETVAEVARSLGIPHETVRRWVRGVLRLDASGPTIEPGEVLPSPSRIDNDQVRDVRERIAAGATHREIADELGITIQAVHAWTSGINRVRAGGPLKGEEE